LSHAGKVLLGALALLILAQLAYGKFGRGVEFFPNIEPDAATVLIHARGNLSIHEKDLLIQEIEHKIMDVEGLRTLYTRVGGDPVNNYGIAEDVIGQIHLEFTAWGTRPSVDSILSEIKTRTANIAGLLIETEKQKDGPPTGKAVQVQLSSSFPELLPDATKIVRGALEEIGGFIDIEDTGALPGIQWELEVDRAQAAKFGLDVTTIGQYIRMVTNGLKVADYRPDDSNEEIDIVLRHTGDRRTLDQLDRVRIQTDFGSIPVGNFVTRSPQPAVGTLQRTDQKRSIMVKADLPPGVNTNLMVTKLKDWIATHADQFDPRIEIAFRGEDEKQKEAADFLVKAFFVALFMMAIILVTQFNSFYQAFLILSAVIMSTIGVMLGLLITGQPFGIIMSGIGVIALAGIIVNNNIVLIDTFDQYRHEFKGKMSTREMILQTGKERLRPVLLTTITTILGLMPMVLQINIDFVGRTVSHGAPSTQWWVQLSTAIAFGLTFSTILTLIVTPCALMFQDRAVRFFKTLFDRLPLPRRLKKQSHDSSSAAP
ncbi:MAG: efflux RND transporter permease subunit, partial [Alphaproteobacteria bacterium]|nr:efflux RND transporter permease subunit [Alphaproteobacteria bacterium]